jgi:Beta-glucan synthesis-associated protein SKN1/KRE6/Sbg1
MQLYLTQYFSQCDTDHRQVAPGVKANRPQSGAAPIKENTINANGNTEFTKQTWYDGLVFHGNTSINPFFYGTYLAETKPNEPVTRGKNQAFQADAIGAMHQLTPAHFKRVHTFRVEWQPGAGGRLDWFTKSHKISPTFSMEGDGKGTDWVHAFSLKDTSLSDLMGSQIPNEPSHLIMNTAISSTWGFPYSVPTWCTKCFDCEDPKCACNFSPGFCTMMSEGVAMYIDHIRVYQSKNDSAHVGNSHTLGCDPPAYPTREWIKGHEYRYMRNPPFSYDDKGPLQRRIQRGGGACENDFECGSLINHENLTKTYFGESQIERRAEGDTNEMPTGRGRCVERQEFMAMFTTRTAPLTKLCKCNEGFTGPHCLAQLHVDTSPSAMLLRTKDSPFHAIQNFKVTPFMFAAVLLLLPFLLVATVGQAYRKKEIRATSPHEELTIPKLNRPISQAVTNIDVIMAGRSV